MIGTGVNRRTYSRSRGAAGPFAERIVVLSPHVDDETLGCGGLMATLSATHEIHVVFVTDSCRSPEHPRQLGANPDRLVAVREQEARSAMGVLGIGPERLHFLGFPDGRLADHVDTLRQTLVARLAQLGEADVFTPFRYDWHSDHVALFRATREAFRGGLIRGRLLEYFVYTQRRLLPGGDVRAFVKPSRAIMVDTSDVADRKLRALECFASQTTVFYDWQRRPILTPQLLRRMCSTPEWFLPWDGARAEAVRAPQFVRLATALEPPLKRVKDGIVEWLRGA